MATDIRTLSLEARSFLVALLLAFNGYALLRAAPVNSSLPVNTQHQYGDHDRRVDRIFRMASDRAELPFWDAKDHLLFHGHNGAIFIFVAETFVRLGAERSLPIQLFGVLLWNVGLLLFFLWVRAASGSELFAGAASLFLLTTPFLLYHCVSIHEDPYVFVFFNATLWCFSCYLATGRKRWLVLAAASYFALCQNYWMYYVSTFVMVLALQHKARRLRPVATVVMGLVPVLAAGTIFLEMTVVHHGVDEAWEALKDTGEERAGVGADGVTAHFQPDEIIASRRIEDDEALMREYPLVVADRVRRSSGLPAWVFGLMLAGLVLLSGREALRAHSWLVWVILAGLSWYVLMVQHTAIHQFAGNYGWFCWTLIVGAFARELHAALRPDKARLVFATLAAAATLALLDGHFIANLRLYGANLRDAG